MSVGAITAGEAYVSITCDNSELVAGLRESSATIQATARNVAAMEDALKGMSTYLDNAANGSADAAETRGRRRVFVGRNLANWGEDGVGKLTGNDARYFERSPTL